MWAVKVNADFSASHQLRGQGGVCEKLHGHNWQVQVRIEGNELNSLGVLVDFNQLKPALEHVLSPMDHTHLNDLPAFQTTNPSCEQIAAYIWRELTFALNLAKEISIKSVEVWETRDCSACYWSDAL